MSDEITQRLQRIDDFHLQSGSHDSIDDGACVMELVSWVVGEPWTDTPECACPIICAFMQSWNDGLPDDERDVLRPLIPRLIGTRSTKAVEERRAIMAADWLIREHTPAWLRLAGLKSQADSLASLPEITDFLQCQSVMPALEAARSDADAAWEAALAAAGGAAWEAAWEAAWDATREAAGAAAWEAAADATWEAAWEAAWGATRTAAKDAAWGAVKDAAWGALSETKNQLQQSAIRLVERMIECH